MAGRVGTVLVLGAMLGWGGGLRGQAAPTAAGSQSSRPSCVVQHVVPSDADVALNARKFSDAAGLYQALLDKTPGSVPAKVGLVRSMIGEGKLQEALDLANQYAAAAPNDAALADVVGSVRFRRGEIDEAAMAFNKAQHLDFCVASVHADIARYQTLAGNFLTAQKQIDVAHQISPDDPAITRQWEQAHGRRMTPEEMIARYTNQMNRPDATEEQKKNLGEAIKRVKAANNGKCEMVDPIPGTKMQLFPVQSTNAEVSTELNAVALDVEMNGKRQRLELDSGASGLVITKAAAARAGLVTEAEFYSYGIGDEGMNRTFVTHVDKLRVGGMEFHNCEVDVLERDPGFGLDGLIGPDVFARWVVTIDTPERELRLDPLPKRPGDAESNTVPTLDLHGVSGNGQDSRDGPHDRFISPEMEKWTRVYRQGHDLIFPAKLNDLPLRLMIMDTGFGGTGALNLDVAKMLGRVETSPTESRGISGYVKHNYILDKPVMLGFASIKQEIRGMEVQDLTNTTRGVPVEISGFIGFLTLRELEISIDYRDDLVKITFDPKKGFHSKGIVF